MLFGRGCKKIVKATYCTVKEEVRKYIAGLLGAHEWGVAIIFMEAMSANRRGRSREEDTTERLRILKRRNLG